MKKDTQWLVTITYDGGNGKFEYESNQKDSYLAIAVAVKEMFKDCIWLDPKTTRISNVEVLHESWGRDAADNSDSNYGEGDL